MRVIIVNGNDSDCISLLEKCSTAQGIRCVSLKKVRLTEKYKFMDYSHLGMESYPESGRIHTVDTENYVPVEIEFDTYIDNFRCIGNREVSPFISNPLEYVVSQYKEDISWLKDVYEQVHVYNKGGRAYPEANVWRWQRLPNIGRESHTYLMHIIDNYDSLADVTVFTQGAIADHGLSIEDLKRIAEDARISGRGQCSPIVEKYTNWGMINHKGKWADELKSGNMTPAKCTLGEFYKMLFNREHPESIDVHYAAIFALRKDVIRRYPIEFYRNAIGFLNSRNPGEGHYFERLWHEMFTFNS